MHCAGCGTPLRWFNVHELMDGTIYGDGCCPGKCDRPDKHERRNMKYRTTPRTAYLAGRFERRDELLHAEGFLANHNIKPGTRWLHMETDMRLSDDEHRKKWALLDVEDVRNADFLIAFSEDLTHPFQYGEGDCVWATDDEEPDGTPHLFVPAIWARGGRHVEFGIALANGLDIAVIGPAENLFHYFDARTPDVVAKGIPPQINHYNSIESFVAWYDENNVLPDDAEPADQAVEEAPIP